MAAIESIGSSARIEGSKLADRKVEKLLSNLAIRSFETRDEQEVNEALEQRPGWSAVGFLQSPE